MASFNPVQKPKETELTGVNHTPQGASHPIAKEFVGKVFHNAIGNILQKQLEERQRRFRQRRAGFTLQHSTENALLMREDRGAMLGAFRKPRSQN